MITIKLGNALEPIWPKTKRVIIHCVNDDNCMGSGFAYNAMKKWPKVSKEYHSWALNRPHTFKLGQAQFVQVEDGIEVVNLIGQRSMGYQEFKNLGVRIPAVRYEALYEGFLRCRSTVKGRFKPGTRFEEHTFHLPMLGAGLAGGDFYKVFDQYVQAFLGTNTKTCFYAYSDKDFSLLKSVYSACPATMKLDEQL